MRALQPLDEDRTAARLDNTLKRWQSALYRQERGLLTGRNASPLDLYKPQAEADLCALEAHVEAAGRDPFADTRLAKLATRFYRLERRACGL